MSDGIIGYWPISNHGGLSVTEMTSDTLTVRWFDDEETEECPIIFEVHEDSEDGESEPCIKYNGTIYFLRDCVKVNGL